MSQGTRQRLSTKMKEWPGEPSWFLGTSHADIPPSAQSSVAELGQWGQGWRHSSRLPAGATWVLFRDLHSGEASVIDLTVEKNLRVSQWEAELESIRGNLGWAVVGFPKDGHTCVFLQYSSLWFWWLPKSHLKGFFFFSFWKKPPIASWCVLKGITADKVRAWITGDAWTWKCFYCEQCELSYCREH